MAMTFDFQMIPVEATESQTCALRLACRELRRMLAEGPDDLRSIEQNIGILEAGVSALEKEIRRQVKVSAAIYPPKRLWSKKKTRMGIFGSRR
jgi:hypothetical protein